MKFRASSNEVRDDKLDQDDCFCSECENTAIKEHIFRARRTFRNCLTPRNIPGLEGFAEFSGLSGFAGFASLAGTHCPTRRISRNLRTCRTRYGHNDDFSVMVAARVKN